MYNEGYNMIVYIDMDDTLCEFSQAYTAAKRANPEIEYPQSIPGFFENLAPKPGAVESVVQLINTPKYRPYILTAPSTRNPLSYTEKRLWIEQYFGYDFVKRLVISPDKSLLKGDYLIDDYDRGKGQDQFEGELILFGSDAYPDWARVMHKLSI